MSAKSYYSSNSDGSDLSDNIYCIFLHISQGVGFNEKDVIGDYKDTTPSQVLVKASLNGVQFEVEGHGNTPDAQFNSNCIWECHINDIKRMKSDNRPIKLECFSKCNRSGIKLCDKLIGTILLPIKCIPISSRLTYGPPKMKAHKLGTLAAEWRYSKPEISLLLMIVKKSIIERGQMELYLRRHNFPKTVSPKLSETAYMLHSQKNIYIQLLEQDGLIQIGNDPHVDCEIFRLHITFKNVKNIEALLHSNAPTTLQGNTFAFSYDLLGQVSNIDIWINHSSGNCYSINEKISVNFKSSFKSLRMYFQQIFFIPIFIYSNGITLAKDNFNVAKILTVQDIFLDNINNSWTTNGEWYFECVYPECSEKASKLLVEYILCIQRVKPANAICDDSVPTLVNTIKTLQAPLARQTAHPVPTSCEKLSIKNVDTNVAIDVDNEVKSVCSASTNTEPSDFIDYDELSYKVVQELEQWKSYQMQKFLLELARKENVYKEQFEFKTAQVMATLERKISTCDQLNGQLDRMIRDFGASTHKTQEQLQLFETMKRDMENNYEKKFMEIGDQMESLKSDILKKDKVTDCNNIKEIKEENASLKGETIRLKDRIGVLQQHLTIAQNGNVPINQLINIISDLGKQSERLKAAEKSSHYYQEQWTDVSHEINKIKFELIKMQEQKSTVKDLDSTDLCLFLHGIISDEQDALTSERSELESIRNVLFKEISMEKE